MATRRIKEITNTATTFASDDFIALDGTTQGTRKMDKDDLIAEVSAGVSGDYLEESNNLSDVASKDTSKLNLEVPDVGTGPQEVPLNSMLSGMAYMSPDSVAMGAATVDNDLTVGNATTGGQVQVIGGAVSAPSFAFSNDPDTGMSRPTSNAVNFVTGGTERVRIDASGRLGVNQTSPTAQLQVDQPASDQSGAAAIKAVGTAYGTNKAIHGYMNTSSSTKSLLYLENGSGSVVNVQGDGLVGIGQSSPVGKLEVAVTPTTSATTVNETADFADSAIISNGGTSANGDRIPLVFNVGNSGANGISAAIVGERESSGWNTALSFWTNGVTSGAEGTDAIQEAMRIDSQGRLGVNQTSPSTNANSIADDLVVGNTGQASGITVVGGTGSTSAMAFGSGGTTIKGGMVYDHPSNSLQFSANSATRWLINSSGNLQANGAYGIDFGTTTTGSGVTVSDGILSDYEVGTWEPTYAPSSGSFTTVTMTRNTAMYVKVGKQVTVFGYILTSDLNTTGGSGNVQISGLPFISSNPGFSSVSVGYTSNWGTNHPAGGYVASNASIIYLTERKTDIHGSLTEMAVSNLNSVTGANYNALMFSATYLTTS